MCAADAIIGRIVAQVCSDFCAGAKAVLTHGSDSVKACVEKAECL